MNAYYKPPRVVKKDREKYLISVAKQLEKIKRHIRSIEKLIKQL